MKKGFTMKHMTKTFVLIFFLLNVSFTQNMSSVTSMHPNVIEGGLGVTWINGHSYTTLSLCPDLSFGKFGVGLNIELLFDNSNNFEFRDTGWDNPFRMIRYIRYGQKYDRFYARIGSLDGATLGNGMIMWHYTNMANYDFRKIGLAFDVDFNFAGFETVLSNLGRSEIYGGRVYVRPIVNTSIPVINDLEFGGTYVTDQDPDTTKDTKDQISEWGLDVSLPLFKTELLYTKLYFDYAEIVDYGNGKAVGVMISVPGIMDLFDLAAKFEHRWIGKQFIPSYFDPLYELQRTAYHEDRGIIYNKQDILKEAPDGKGYFGQLAGTIIGKLHIMGSFQKISDVPRSGMLHMEALMPDLIPNIRLRATYDKTNIETFADINTLDLFSVAAAEAGYKIYPFVYLSLRYRWNFIYNEDTGVYETQERMEPRISFAYEF
jgi:hypothetical protein